jgi:hypothetical protein
MRHPFAPTIAARLAVWTGGDKALSFARRRGAMAKYEPKTKYGDADVAAYVAAIEHPTRRADAITLLDIYGEVTRLEPKMFGPSIIGYGSYSYETKSGCAHGWASTRPARAVFISTNWRMWTSACCAR